MPAFSPSRILRATALQEKGPNWSSTLALPKSQFPARASPEQIEKYRQRCADDLYAWQRANRPSRSSESGREGGDGEFVLHDGPPYANGAVHVGHALNKVLKDLMLRWELSQGKRVRYRPGWDCHGLPIELKALQQPKSPGNEAKTLRDKPGHEAQAAITAGAQMTAPEIRAAARSLASETIEIQKKRFREWGVMGEWDNPYTTMSKDFEIRQLGIFREMVRKGLISRHHRPVHWSPSSRTALAEAELEYDDDHKCTAAFVQMPFIRLPQTLRSNPAIKAKSVSALIWTTTPWTLPANKAIAVKDDIEYCVIEINSDSEKGLSPDQLVVGKERIDHVLSHLPEGTTAKIVVESIFGSELSDGATACFNLFTGTESPVLTANFVTATSGTGLVHMAPGHGLDDYQVCQQNGIGPAFAPVDDEGRYTSEAFPTSKEEAQFQGLDVQTGGVKAVLAVLAKPAEYLLKDIQTAGGLLLAAHKFRHKNPIDWRTKQPIIVRATAQWFADVSAIKDKALSALDDVIFIPESGKTRLRSFVEGRSQWCISRQRAWGVPIPALYHAESGEVCITDESVSHIISVIEQKGVDAWFADAPDDGAWILPSLEPGNWVRGTDTMDVWFDSGTTWASLEDRNGTPLSDVYCEGTDQHRGWFQSSLLTTIASQDAGKKPLAPFKTLATHGFTLDAEGRKMSKSLGNVISPEQVLSGSLLPTTNSKGKGKPLKAPQPPSKKSQQTAMGPDVLRLWVASSDYTRDISISQPLLQSVQQALQKFRVTFKFLLGVLHDYPTPAPQPTLLTTLRFADRTVLAHLAKCSRAVHAAYREYKFYAGVGEIGKFVNNDLSAGYFEIVKDVLYAGGVVERRRVQTVLVFVLRELMSMLGPATPLLVEEVWEWMPVQMKGGVDGELHPLRQVWSRPFDLCVVGMREDARWEAEVDVFRKLSSAVKVAQEEARKARVLGSGLACKVEILLPGDDIAGLEWLAGDELSGLLVVSQAEVKTEPDSTAEQSWRFEQPVTFEWAGKVVSGKVVVLPPEGQKCVRCWKYTAEEDTVPCSPCRAVLTEAEP